MFVPLQHQQRKGLGAAEAGVGRSRDTSLVKKTIDENEVRRVSEWSAHAWPTGDGRPGIHEYQQAAQALRAFAWRGFSELNNWRYRSFTSDLSTYDAPSTCTCYFVGREDKDKGSLIGRPANRKSCAMCVYGGRG